jgi:hypothetical protein
MDITPVMQELIKDEKLFKMEHSLPVVMKSHTPLMYRRHSFGDEL